jgi:hypothetical protein
MTQIEGRPSVRRRSARKITTQIDLFWPPGTEPPPIGQTNDATDFLLVKRLWIISDNGRKNVI